MVGLVPPYIAGMEFSGLVHDIGARADALRLGQLVMGLVNPRRPEGGAHTRYLRVAARSVVPMPPDLDFAAAAAVPLNGLTAKYCLDGLGLHPGQVLLVTGAAGAVGSYVIQLAKNAGIHVIADAKESDVQHVMTLGADQVVPRGALFATSVLAAHPGGVDGLVDAALLGRSAFALVKETGVVALLRGNEALHPTRSFVVNAQQQFTQSEHLAWVVDQVRAGVLHPRIAANLPFERGQEAFAMVRKGGLRGRVVLHW
jgi:NADPH:quinone reductase-like Zn-dependent oxidoreductase